MAFGGNMGAAAAMTPVGVFRPMLPEADFTLNQYDAQNRLAYRDVATMEVGGGQKLLQTLYLVLETVGTPPLGAFVNDTENGSAADTGVLVSQAPAANQHGLPVNFGPGRGNWTINDVARLQVETLQLITIPAATSNHLIPLHVELNDPPSLFLTDIHIVIKNTSAQVIASMMIRIQYDHTLVF